MYNIWNTYIDLIYFFFFFRRRWRMEHWIENDCVPDATGCGLQLALRVRRGRKNVRNGFEISFLPFWRLWEEGREKERERERNAEDNNQLSRKKPIPAETRNRNGSFRLRQFYPVDGTDASPPNVPQLHLQHQTWLELTKINRIQRSKFHEDAGRCWEMLGDAGRCWEMLQIGNCVDNRGISWG